MTKILFIQPCGLNSQGGGPKILRSLVSGHETEAQSICSSPAKPPPTLLANELHVPSRPYLGRLESTRFAPWLDHLFRTIWEPIVRKRLFGLVRQIKPQHIHLLAHTDDFWPAFQVARALQIPVTLAVHDDLSYNLFKSPRLPKAFDKLGVAWKKANRRIVIAKALGEELNRRLGHREYEIVTDSVNNNSGGTRLIREGRLNVYFMGALHLSYQENFNDLMRAMKHSGIKNSGQPKLILRGGGVDSPRNAIVPEVRAWGSERDVEGDLADADLLYLPLPFQEEFQRFVRFSLSTKMVTYLGSGIPILYHGPSLSAVSELLAAHHAALRVTEPGVEPLVRALNASVNQRRVVAESARRLARMQFHSAAVRGRFWKYYEQNPNPAHVVPL